MIQVSTVKCAYCGKEDIPQAMQYGTVAIVEGRWNAKKSKYTAYVTKMKGWSCRVGCRRDV